MSRILIALSFVGLTFSLGCSSGSIEERMVGYMESMASAIEANQDDCAKMGVALKKIVDDNKSLLAEMKKTMKEAKGKKEKPKVDEKLMARLKKASKGVEAAMKCKDDKNIMAAMKAMK